MHSFIQKRSLWPLLITSKAEITYEKRSSNLPTCANYGVYSMLAGSGNNISANVSKQAPEDINQAVLMPWGQGRK